MSVQDQDEPSGRRHRQHTSCLWKKRMCVLLLKGQCTHSHTHSHTYTTLFQPSRVSVLWTVISIKSNFFFIYMVSVQLLQLHLFYVLLTLGYNKGKISLREQGGHYSCVMKERAVSLLYTEKQTVPHSVLTSRAGSQVNRVNIKMHFFLIRTTNKNDKN